MLDHAELLIKNYYHDAVSKVLFERNKKLGIYQNILGIHKS